MTNEELNLMKKNECFIAHCPTSNINLKSGTCPIKKFVQSGINVGLGSDVSGGHSMDMFEIMRSAIISSTQYLILNGGGSFFGKTGSFEPGYEFNALVLKENEINHDSRSLQDRLERLLWSGSGELIIKRYLSGQSL
ncbi:hypothetical protein ACOME3_004519 [Neoechinorhynchus agilis]